MPKLIAILESDPRRVEAMKAWLDDRMFMYDVFIAEAVDKVLETIRQRPGDLLVLCIGRETLNGRVEDAVRAFQDFAESPFPVLIHSAEGNTAGKGLSRPMHDGGRIEWVVAPDDPVAFAAAWYPALKKAMLGQQAEKAALPR